MLTTKDASNNSHYFEMQRILFALRGAYRIIYAPEKHAISNSHFK